MQERLEIVARELDLGVPELVRRIRVFKEVLGGGGREKEAQTVVDSLRNRTRDLPSPRYGDLEAVITQDTLEQNVIAVQQMREHIAATLMAMKAKKK